MKTLGKCIRVPIIIGVLLLSAAGCEKKAGTGVEPDGNGAENAEERARRALVSEETAETTKQPEATLKIEMNQSDNPKQGEAEEEEEKLPVLGDEFLLVQLGIPIPGPEDVVIGKLQDRYTEDREAENVFLRIDTFLSAFAQSLIDTGSIHPDSAGDLTRTLRYHIERGNVPNDHRIGAARVEEENGSANIRLLGGAGRASGEVFLAKAEERWYITDLQIDLGELAEEYQPEEEYEPGVYRWIDRY